MIEILPQLLIALVALGMGVAFVSADWAAPASRALALALVFVGTAVVANVGYLQLLGHHFAQMPGWLGLPEGMAIIAFLEWLVRVRRTMPGVVGRTGLGGGMLRLGQAAGIVYIVLAFNYPEIRARDFLFSLSRSDALKHGGFWLFAVPVLFATLGGLIGVIQLLLSRPDRPERVRVLAMAGSVPFLIAGFVIQPRYGALSVAVGEMILLVGAVHYHVRQGQRGEFMARFLSTQVADLVRSRGLKAAMQKNYLEITVVSVDLRDFTAFAEAHPASRVIEVLREYYEVVGAAVAEFGGTIKDYAGDGILILVGAPLPLEDHARRALKMALRIRAEVGEVTRRWSSEGHTLGVGLGVASGFVVVGVIGASSRLEYTAVGSTVNLASRLCEQAGADEILVSAHTRLLAGKPTMEARPPMTAKGFPEPVELYAMQEAPAALGAVEALPEQRMG